MQTETLSNSIVWAATQNLVTTTVMIPIVALLCRTFRDRPALHGLLWSIVLLKFLIPPLPFMAWQLPEVENRIWPRTEVLSNWSTREMPIPAKSSGTVTEFADQNSDLLIDGAAIDVCAAPSMRFRGLTVYALASLWLAGAGTLLFFQLSRVRGRYRIVRRGIPAAHRLAELVNRVARQMGVRSPTTVVVPRIATPFLCCFGRIRLVWPDAFAHCGNESIRAIVAHEVAHLRRRDHWFAWFEFIGSLIWWWNPLFWFTRSRLRCSAEMACDAMALAAYPDDRCLYAETLLWLSTVSETGAPPLTLAVSDGTPSSLERRIKMIVSIRVSDKLPIVGLAAAVLLALSSAPSLTIAQSDGQTPRIVSDKIEDSEERTSAEEEIEERVDLEIDLELTQTPQQDSRPVLSDPVAPGSSKSKGNPLKERAKVEAEIERLNQKVKSLNDVLRNWNQSGKTPGSTPATSSNGKPATEAPPDGQVMILRSEDGKAVSVFVERNGKTTRLSGNKILFRNGKTVEGGELILGVTASDPTHDPLAPAKENAKSGSGVGKDGSYRVMAKGDDGTLSIETWRKVDGEEPRLMERSALSLEQAEQARSHLKEGPRQAKIAKEQYHRAMEQADQALKNALAAQRDNSRRDSSVGQTTPAVDPKIVRDQSLTEAGARYRLREKLDAEAAAMANYKREFSDAASASPKLATAKQVDLISLATAYADAVSSVEIAADAEAKQRAGRKANLLRRIAQVEFDAVSQDCLRMAQLVKAGAASAQAETELQTRRNILREILAADAKSTDGKSTESKGDPLPPSSDATVPR